VPGIHDVGHFYWSIILALIFLDLDGTVIGSNGVSDATWAAIEALQERCQMVVCTGRTRAGVAARIAERISETGPHIFENGGLVSPFGQPPWFQSQLDYRDLASLIAQSERVDATLEFYTAEGVFCSRDHPDCRLHAEVLDIPIEFVDLYQIAESIPVIRAHWIMRPEVVDDTLNVELVASELGVARSPVLPKNVFASITAKGTSKGSAARIVAEKLGVSLADAYAVGDSEGDRPILEVVGHARVMGDSPATLLSDFEAIGDVDNDGLADFLRTLKAESAP